MSLTFEAACSRVEGALGGSDREEILASVSATGELEQALVRLREGMRTHVFRAGAQHINLDGFVREYDRRTRQDGFHVLHDWDGKADHVNEDIIPVDVLNYLIDVRGDGPVDVSALSILLDYYFLHILALLTLRIWDEGDADGNLRRVNRLLGELQGPNGSGQRFADNAETLILIATSHFELHERGYDGLLQRTKTLNQPHRLNIALGHAVSMGCHLRFGFEATYGRDTVRMRSDNVADYPWLCFALVTLMREYSATGSAKALAEREGIAEALLNGLSADARAFVGDPPASLSPCEAERSEFRDLFHRHRDVLVLDFERHRPSPARYSPLSFFFNFSHNIVKGIVVDALLRGKAWDLTLNDLLSSLPQDDKTESKALLATTLMGYARENPDTVNGRPTPAIVYDPPAGRHAFSVTMKKIREGAD